MITVTILAGCSDGLESPIASEGEVELTTLNATIASKSNALQTRADGDPEPPRPVVYLEDAISRYRFVDNDEITFTSIRRTQHPLGRFNYSDITFRSNSSGAWDRDKNTGSDNEPSNAGIHPVRIYWSDATSQHTFIGYSKPNVLGFDWGKTSGNNLTYFGSIGNPNETTQINYNPLTPEKETITIKDKGVEKPVEIPISSLMRAEDLLLAYDTVVVAEASVANIKFYHGLSSVKVKVMLSEFYGSELDGYAIVDSMVLENQPTLYRWEQTSYKAAAKSNTHSENNPRSMFLWDYVPEGVGENAGKTFTFYGITVPQENGYQMQDLTLNFRVRYPDPLKTDLAELKKTNSQPTHWQEKAYRATIPAATPVYFHPGQCTIINMKLNHQDEEITIGAQYTDWEFVPTPDEGSLKKNSTFLQEAPEFVANENTRKVTIANDSKATEDDATWLYYQKNPDGSFVAGSDNGKVLLDIYGNTGTAEKPYTISTANQLLSLAYEVSNGGHSFEGKYIKLDAGIIMQKNTDSETVSWLGIGTDTNPFQGTFQGGGRKITLLKGAPLFNNVGNKALIDNVTIENPLMGPVTITSGNTTSPNPNYGKLLTGNAALAQNNAGVVCGCRVNGDVGCTGSGTVGALVGTNSGTIFACHHTGLVKGTGDVAGLVGTNTGSILFSYHAGELVTTGEKYGIAPSGTITDCYYDNKLATSVTAVTNVTGISTGDMQKRAFVDDVYTADEAAELNTSNLVKDKNDVEPGGNGYIPTYKSGYIPVAEGDPKPTNTEASWNGRIIIWLTTGAGSSDARRDHYATHKYLYQPASYPKVQ